MKRIYMLSTEHLENGLWFREEEDFKVAMNYVAIEAARHPEVAVLAFTLMSNHVHFVQKGERERVEDFVNSFKRRYSMYMQLKYGIREFLRNNGLDIKFIPYEDEAPERVIAYVQMNCVAAGICAHPSQYPWGSGNAFFCSTPLRGKRIGELSARARMKLLHSESDAVPKDWMVGDEGYVLPENYLSIREIETLFHSPKRMNYFLTSSSKAKKRLEIADEKLPAFRDQTILSALPDLCMSLFRKESFRQLLPEEQSEFARQIRFRFSADATQIARVCGITYAQAAALLDAL